MVKIHIQGIIHIIYLKSSLWFRKSHQSNYHGGNDLRVGNAHLQQQSTNVAQAAQA